MHFLTYLVHYVLARAIYTSSGRLWPCLVALAVVVVFVGWLRGRR